MNFKTTIVLLVLLAGVGTYFGITRFRDKKAETSTSDSSKLVNIDINDVTKLALTQPDGSRIVLDKSGSQNWKLVEPMSAPAESFEAGELVRQISSLQSRGQLPADQVASVGLDHPSYTVELTGKDGKVSKLSFGPKPKIGDTFYVLVGDRTKPDVINANIYDQLDKPAASYRSKKLLDVTSDQIRQVTITRAGNNVRLQKDGADWKIVEPKAMPGDSSAISSLMFAIADLNASDFVQSPGSTASYGLAKPTMTVSFSTTAPAAAQPTTAPAGTTIAFGRFQSIEQKDVYASVNGGPVVTISASTEDSLNKTALDLRDKKVVDIDPAHVTSITLAVNRSATTQPTTQPSQQYEYTLARRKEAPAAFGPVLPSAPASAAPATQPSVASTEPTTQPAVASTEPATQPAVASTQPASKWVFESGGSGDAIDSQVDAILGALHPLQATKFLDKAPTTEPAGNYTLTVHVGPANGKGPQEVVLHFTSPGSTGNVIGSSEHLTYELDRAILDKLDAKFR
jgi:hypothetical protein